MANWDAIYKNYQQGGNAWATLSEGIDPRFIAFIEKNDFSIRKAFDIGCGNGKYLALLESKGFQTDGIDSSPTAVEMTKKILSAKSEIQVANMYEFAYPENAYDFILSVSTLHHGYKDEIVETIKKIHTSLISQGMIFITLPNFEASHTWDTFKEDTELAPGTYAPNSGPEEGLPHSFFTEQEVRNLFSDFKNIRLDLDKIGRWFITGSK